MPCDKIDCHFNEECHKAYGKFLYPPCASESVEPNADSLQQLKAEIAAVVEQLINTDSSKPLSSICDAIKRLRQLSAV